MTTSVYVGNLGSSTTEDMIRAAFVGAGFQVKNVLVMRSPQTDRSRGFGFVEVGSTDEATAAIQTMNGTTLDGRPIKVGVSRERLPSRSDGRSFQSYSGLGGGLGGPRRSGGGAKRKSRS